MIKFKQLWENHPTITGEDNPCVNRQGKKNFINQCAIRVGVALSKSDVNTALLPGAIHCWHGHAKSEGHVIRAEELANALTKYPIAGLSRVIKVEPENFAKELRGRKGIIFFKDYWQRTNNGVEESLRNRSGDHIDLWNGSRLTSWRSWFRIHAVIGRFGPHTFSSDTSDYRQAKEIWFWRLLF